MSGGVASSQPKLRSDLILSPQATPDGTALVVKDPVSGRFFRFGPVESFIAEHLDAKTTLDVICERAESRFGAHLALETLIAFVKNLDRNHLLEGADSDASMTERESRSGGRLRGSLLSLRFPFFDPDRVITRLERHTRRLFTPQFVVIAGAMILVAIALLLANGRALVAESAGLLQLSTIPVAMALLIVIVSAHEFAHGVTCKHFGGEVREMGFMLFYFQPAFYCNVSDAWLFPEKSKRLWVSFAGVFFELFVWSIATLTWWLTDTDTWMNYAALVVMTVSGIKTLVNLNPFIKLDGYYLLTDALDIPNLRKKAFRYVGDQTRRLLGLGAEMAKEISRRERRIYLAYGVVATAFSVSLLTWVYIAAGRTLIEMRQPGLLACLTLLVTLRSGRYYQKLFGRSSSRLDPDDGKSADRADRGPLGLRQRAKGSHRTNGGHKANGSPESTSSGRSPLRLALWTALAVCLLALLLFGRMQLRIPGPVSVLPLENADVRAEVEGTVDEVLVDEGDVVAAGDVIARLTDRTSSADLVGVEAEIRETRAALSKLEAGPTAEEIAVARQAVARAEDRIEFANARLARLEGLLATSSVPRQEVDDARELATTATNDLAAAGAALDVLLRGSRPEDIAATRARLDGLLARRDFFTDQLGRLEVVSRASGVVATPSRELMLLPGRLIAKGDLVARVFDFDSVDAHIVVAEKEIADVRPGQRVVLRTRAHPDLEFYGVVKSIATSAEGSMPSDPRGAGPVAAPPSRGSPGRAFLVTSQIDNSTELLKPGMTGQAKVLAGERRIIDLITRRTFRTLKVEVWSWW